MDAEKIISLPKYHKKTFVALLTAIYLISILIAHFYFDQPTKDIILDQIKSIASALITALFGLIMILPFIPSKEKGETIEIPPKEITAEFDQLLESAIRWRYKGNFGRYLRGKVLPSLASKRNVHVTACLIDPNNLELCKSHAEYRGNINAIDKGKKYDANTVSLEVVVTIVIASWYVANRNMDIDIYLSSAFDPIRIDSNDEAMILTVEDRRSPALKITKKHFTYEHFELQMETARKQARKTELTGMRKGIELAEITKADIENVLNDSGMEQLCNSLTSQKILLACQQSKNPYEN
jgi:hypothetical protein